MIRRSIHWIAACAALAACLPGPSGGRGQSNQPSQWEIEDLPRKGGRALRPSINLNEANGKFPGALLYQNGDAVSLLHRFPSAGRYLFTLRGASNNRSRAGITVFVDSVASGTTYFPGPEPTAERVLVDINHPGPAKVELVVTTDIGESDTLLDSLAIERQGDLLAPPAPPREGAVRSKKYRNLFIERGYETAAVKAKLDGAFGQLFHGDLQSEAVYFEDGKNANGPLAYIADIGNDDVRSEGMSYGMMICLQLGKRREFDALWNWAQTHMYHRDPAHPARGYFSWSLTRKGVAKDEMPAPDGEEYFAMALYFADARWGSGTGIRDYRGLADRLLDDMKNRADVRGPVKGGRVTTVSSLFNPKTRQIRFSPDNVSAQAELDFTDPSYHLPAFYELFAVWGPPADAAFWKDAATESRQFFVKAAHPLTGLCSDYANFDGSPKARREDPQSVQFRYDAWRTVMNWSVDQAWWAVDTRSSDLSDRLQAFFESQGIARYGNRFTRDGQQTGDDHSAGLVAMNAVGSLTATHPRAWRFVDELWSLPVPRGKWRYYDGMLYLLGFLHVSGTFRAYEPTN